MTSGRVHFMRWEGDTMTACGLFDNGLGNAGFYASDDPSDVTCDDCKGEL